MPQHYDPRQSQLPPSYPYSDYYPGLGPYEIKAQSSSLMPFSSPSQGPTPVSPVTPKPAASGGGLSLPSMSDLKGMVDRLGGIDGILDKVGQVQKVMQTVQQFAPMAKLFTAFLPGGKSGSAGSLEEYRPRRRKSGKRKKSTSGSTGSGSRKRSTSGKKGSSGSGKSSKTGKRRR
ncbi:hypothetical protein [Paenibacillus senegalimassiliensis]|uniref:hypothetical protein n=1 Tax=Paenibacillus senegalimassiliensis TaxID=1737426 RepID=UPI00073F7B4E|nr:hypothetical protein [Paenibacillus senegalimassiliensis]